MGGGPKVGETNWDLSWGAMPSTAQHLLHV